MINKNVKLFESRYRNIVAIILLLMVVLAIRLFIVTVIQNDKWASEASDQNTKVITTSAPRGNIYDKYGRLLAGNKQIFTVQMNVSSLKTEQINNSCYQLINILIDNGDKYTDNFPIKITSSGKFYYTYKKQIEKWLVKQGYDKNTTAAQAFRKLRTKYGIESSMNRYEAMKVLNDQYNVYPPISEKTMVYTYDQELESFLGKFGFTQDEIDAGISAKDCFAKLRENYSIDKSLSNKEARKIFVIRNEVATNGFTRYNPITVAKDLNKKTIAYIEEANIPGVSISSESERYYPYGTTACHIIGYMGSISESDASYYVDKLGYSASDMIGLDGIEAAYEETLHGTPGTKKIRVNSSGEYVSTISETAPVKGKDVYLTIDIDLQKTAEAALKKAILENENSESGATAAVDPSTGNVLAMASYPVFDPNMFADGITDKEWESVQQSNPRDSLSPAPLLDYATMCSVQPGSTFKPITAITALQQGLNPNAYIYDKGYINYGNRQWACSAYNDYGGNHGNEDLEWGIGNSCNYYFYCIATGKDWGTGASLGYNISVDNILNTAKKFGLGSKTGIEIGEAITPLASAQRKMQTYHALVWDALYSSAHSYFPSKVLNNYSELTKNIDEISSWIYDNPSYNEILTLLKEKTDVKSSEIETVASVIKFDYFEQAKWTTGDQFNISIGQGDNAYTPLQMANYIATVGNGGIKHQVSVVQGVEGEGTTVRKAATKIKLKSDTIPEVIKGMKRVCSSGTLSGVFSGFPVTVAGKTGTAENQSIKQPASEVKFIKKYLSYLNSSAGSSVKWSQVVSTMKALMKEAPDMYSTEDETVDDAVIKASGYKITQSMINANKGSYDYYSWTVALAPADDPEISVSVLLIQGGYSSNAAPVAKTIITKYLNVYGDDKPDTTKTDNTGSNSID